MFVIDSDSHEIPAVEHVPGRSQQPCLFFPALAEELYQFQDNRMYQEKIKQIKETASNPHFVLKKKGADPHPRLRCVHMLSS
jgi:hypothetical protein